MIIYNIDNTAIVDVPITSNAEHEEELGKSDYVRLSWVGVEKQVLPVGAYIVPFTNGLRYRLLEPYTPNQNNESEWKYEPEFQHPLMWLSKIPFTYTTVDKNKNMSYVSQDWPYLGLTTSLLEVVVGQINDLFGFTSKDDKFTYRIIGNVDTTVNVTFSSTDIISALNTIASACTQYDCEWHISWENKCLYFGQIFFDQGEDTPTLKVGENIGKVSVSNSKDGYYNVFFPQGSTRNISTRLTNGHYLASSLRLGLNFPYYEGCKYEDGLIDTRTDTNEPKQVLSLIFDDVYPHVNCYVYNVRHRTATLLDETTNQPKLDAQGNEIVYSIWYMRLAYPLTTLKEGFLKKSNGAAYFTEDNGIRYYWYDYYVDKSTQIIDGHKLMGQFTANTHEGALPQPLLGQPTSTDGFEMQCHQADSTVVLDDGTTVMKGDFEITYVDNNDIIIPTTEDDGLYPRGNAMPDFTANEVILYNIIMGEAEIRAAQDDLLVKTKAEITRRQTDFNNYSFPSYPHIFESNNPNLYVGKKVVFDDGAGNTLNTRILKLTTKIDFPFEQQITVGNQKIKGSTSQLKEDVRTMMSGNWSGGGISVTEARNIIKNYGSTLFLSKTEDDIAQGHKTFNDGISVNNGIIADKAQTDALENTGDFTNRGNIENGGNITNSGSITTKDLTVTGLAHFFSLTIDEIRATGGAFLATPAGGFSADIVEPYDADKSLLSSDSSDTPAYWRIYWRAEQNGKSTLNMWVKGDMAVCQTFDVAEGTTQNTANRRWWRLVTATSNENRSTGFDYTFDIEFTDANAANGAITKTNPETGEEHLYHWIEVSNTSNSDGIIQYYDPSDTPQAGDEVVQLGYWGIEKEGALTNDDDRRARRSAIYYSAYSSMDSGLQAPFFAFYEGINHFADLKDFRKSYKDANKMVVYGEVHMQSGKDYYRAAVDRGAYNSEATYNQYDRVSYDGSLWLYVSETSSSGVTPGTDDTKWLRQVSKGDTGATGATGADGKSVYSQYSVDGDNWVSELEEGVVYKYIRTSQDGKTWSDPIKIQGEDGQNGVSVNITPGMGVLGMNYNPSEDTPIVIYPHLWVGNEDRISDCLVWYDAGDALDFTLLSNGSARVEKLTTKNRAALRSAPNGVVKITIQYYGGTPPTTTTTTDEPTAAAAKANILSEASDASTVVEDTTTTTSTTTTTEPELLMTFVVYWNYSMATSGLDIDDTYTKLWTQYVKSDGTVNKAEMGTLVEEDGTTKVKMSADQIELEGYVTANKNTQIDTEGNLITKNATLNGYLRSSVLSDWQNDTTKNATRTYVITGNVVLDEDGNLINARNDSPLNLLVGQSSSQAITNYVHLPLDPEFVGARVIIIARPYVDNTGYIKEAGDNPTYTGYDGYTYVDAGKVWVKHVYVDPNYSDTETDSLYLDGDGNAAAEAAFASMGAQDWFLGGGRVTVEKGIYYPNEIMFKGGVIELLGVESTTNAQIAQNTYELTDDKDAVAKADGTYSATGNESMAGQTVKLCQWVVVNVQCDDIEYSHNNRTGSSSTASVSTVTTTTTTSSTSTSTSTSTTTEEPTANAKANTATTDEDDTSSLEQAVSDYENDNI